VAARQQFLAEEVETNGHGRWDKNASSCRDLTFRGVAPTDLRLGIKPNDLPKCLSQILHRTNMNIVSTYRNQGRQLHCAGYQLRSRS
jgi:hypothetical protein